MLTLQLVEAALAASAISITISRARATKPLRAWVEQRSELFGHLINCPYCISHWCAIVFSLTFLPWPGSAMGVLVDVFAMVAIAALVTGAAMKLLHMDEKRIEELEDEVEALDIENRNLKLTLHKIAEGD